MRNKSLLVLEVVWIVIGLFSLAGGVMYAIAPGGTRTYIFFGMAVISFFFAFIRHHQRKNTEK